MLLVGRFEFLQSSLERETCVDADERVEETGIWRMMAD